MTVLLVAIALFLSVESHATGLLANEPRIEIHCNNGVLAKGYSRLPRLSPSAVFTYVITVEPEPKEEWRLGDPVIFWGISPAPAGGCFAPTEEKAELYLSPDKSFGVSYTINLLITWPLENQKTGEIERESRSAFYVVDAVEYSFKMRCLLGARASGGLLDNYPAMVNVTAKGCTRTDLLDLSFRSRPNPRENGTPVNKKGTDMQFSKESTLKFKVEKTYWYGLGKPNCCHHNRFPYEVKLFERREGLVATEEVTVGWPDEHPEAEVEVDFPAYQLLIVKEGDNYKAELVFSEFERRIVPFDEDSVTDQYREETIKEEKYHIKQFTGEVPWKEGGEPDIYSVEKIRESLVGDLNDSTIRFFSRFGESKDEFSDRIQNSVDAALRKERMISEKVMSTNLYYRESKAKAHAGYNAAWMYHCTYEDDEHLESSLVHKTRQEVEKEENK